MVDVHLAYRLWPETLFLAVEIVDRCARSLGTAGAPEGDVLNCELDGLFYG